VLYLWENLCDEVGKEDLTLVTTVKSFTGRYFNIFVFQLQSLNIHGSSEGRLELNIIRCFLQLLLRNKNNNKLMYIDSLDMTKLLDGKNVEKDLLEKIVQWKGGIVSFAHVERINHWIGIKTIKRRQYIVTSCRTISS